MDFNLRRPTGQRSGNGGRLETTTSFQSTLPNRAATEFSKIFSISLEISIPTTQPGSDDYMRQCLTVAQEISIRTAQMGSDSSNDG